MKNAKDFAWVATESCPLEAVTFVPAMAVTRSAMDSFLVPLLSLASIMAMLSLATLTAAALRSFRLRATVTAADSEPLFATVIPPLVASATVAA